MSAYHISHRYYVNGLADMVAAENRALNKPVFVSSELYFTPPRINDGDVATGFSTRDLPWSFAAVDLEDVYEIASVSVRLSETLRKWKLNDNYRPSTRADTKLWQMENAVAIKQIHSYSIVRDICVYIRVMGNPVRNTSDIVNAQCSR